VGYPKIYTKETSWLSLTTGIPKELMNRDQGNKRTPNLEYELIFDGGSRGNPGEAFGSYQIKHGRSKARKPVRLHLGTGTNNEAEYRTLIRALEDLLHEFERDGIDPSDVWLKVFGDSQLVIRQLQMQWKAKDARMRTLRDQVLRLGNQFGSVEFMHQARWRSVAALGH
jgi:ribonuclease HI